MAVMQCSLCGKSFDLESSLKRHGYYCRSRQGSSASRARSCTACIKAKTRCNNQKPACSRCQKKLLACQYTSHAAGQNQPQKDPMRTEEHDSSLIEPFSLSALSDLSAIQGSSAPFHMSYSGKELPETPFSEPEQYSSILHAFTSDDSLDMYGSTPGPLESFSDNMYNELSASQIIVSNSEVAVINPATLMISTPSINVRSFGLRFKTETREQKLANLILHHLKTYPEVVVRTGALPTVLHPRLVDTDSMEKDIEPITNCIALMHMLSSPVKSSRKLFWENVRMQCDWFCAKCQDFNTTELLAAMQALILYILTRLKEGETEYNNLDACLIRSVLIVSRCSRNNLIKPVAQGDASQARWRTWILQESGTRLCILYQILNLLVYFEPAEECALHETGILLAPLPSSKYAWEITEEAAWDAEFQKSTFGLEKSFALAMNGDVVELYQGMQRCLDQSTTPLVQEVGLVTNRTPEWDDWCHGADGLDGLIMLTASLLL